MSKMSDANAAPLAPSAPVQPAFSLPTSPSTTNEASNPPLAAPVSPSARTSATSLADGSVATAPASPPAELTTSSGSRTGLPTIYFADEVADNAGGDPGRQSSAGEALGAGGGVASTPEANPDELATPAANLVRRASLLAQNPRTAAALALHRLNLGGAAGAVPVVRDAGTTEWVGLPRSGHVGIRWATFSAVLVAAAAMSVLVGTASIWPAAQDLDARTHDRAAYTLLAAQRAMQRMLLDVRGPVLAQIAYWRQHPTLSATIARRNLFQALQETTRSVVSASVAIADTGGTEFADLYTFVRNGVRVPVALTVDAAGTRTETQVDTDGRQMLVYSQSTNYALANQTWWQAMDAALTGATAVLTATTTTAPNVTAIWTNLPLSNGDAWVALLAHARVSVQRNVTVTAAASLATIASALAAAPVAAAETAGNSGSAVAPNPPASVYLVDPVSQTLIAASTGLKVTEMPGSRTPLQGQMPLAAVALQTTDAWAASVAAHVGQYPATYTVPAAGIVVPSTKSTAALRVWSAPLFPLSSGAISGLSPSFAAAWSSATSSATSTVRTLLSTGAAAHAGRAFPTTWTLLYVELQSTSTAPTTAMINSLLLIAATLVATLASASLVVTFPLAHRLNRATLVLRALAHGIHPELRLLAAPDPPARPREIVMVYGAIAALARAHEFVGMMAWVGGRRSKGVQGGGGGGAVGTHRTGG
ncbi:hypothetical protein AMAG_16082 [Allomyces macrogynus ATCC 38327]|uniref:Uncharacterized protein n=1 Tax=Allomyces macrogynus (strain ATCC 38327) TaxID=578462 RepID=A0A0L0TAI7_ALLM3|nr:hypothetical protein AMAG_16082 [Allomyces macrogynus ATCC 38327]|eukprot:KNE71777.1 hypothetical protein AMAG_16082 [Allomyces macrogynus ATCC 38327]